MFLRVMNVLHPHQNAALTLSGTPHRSLCGTARFNSARALLVFFAVPFFGCAGRAHVRDRIPQTQTQEQGFWNGCQETVPAIADGFQHFVCADVHSKRWEVLIRTEPTK